MIAEELADRVALLEERIEKLEKSMGAGRLAGTTQGKKTSAKEFLMKKVVKSELQKVLALAYYIEHQEALASFNVPDLERVFRSAREKLPKNMNDAVNKNVARGLLMEAAEKKESKKAWNLTSTGERFVENDMIKAEGV
jgi:uncharacterized Ntn-hydrolase superfamily protein